MKILITGGHMTPALAVIEALPSDAQVVYVGRKYALEGDSAISLEYRVLTGMHIPFVVLQPGRLQRKFTRYTLPALGKVPKSMVDAFEILRKEKPDIILSFGGHVAFPICFVASLLRIPIVVHEQTLEVGGANRLIAKLATKICVSWESSLSFFPKEKVVLTGNPLLSTKISADIQEAYKKKKNKYPIIAITGGSLGSHAINALIEPIVEKLLAKYFLIHQTGDAQEFKDYEKLSEIKEKLPYTFQERYILKKFIYPSEVASIYAFSDLVISRAGMNTVLTLLLVNTPTLLIPLPFSQRQEQMKNAMLVKEFGLGEVLLQDGLTSESLLANIEKMIKYSKNYKNKDEEKMRSIHKNAAKKIIQVVYGAKASSLQKKI